MAVKGKNEKIFRFAISLFAVAVIVSSGVKAFSLKSEFSITGSGEEYIETYGNINKSTMEYAFANLLTENGIEFNEIYIDMDILEDNSININNVFVDLKNSEDFSFVYSLVLKETGIKIKEG